MPRSPLVEDPFEHADRRERERAERRRARGAGRPDGEADAQDGPAPADGPQSTRLLQSRAGRTLVGVAALIALGTVIGLLALWPGHVDHARPAGSKTGATQTATVTAQRTVSCPGPTAQRCLQIIVDVAGTRAPITTGPVGPTTPHPDVGTKVRVAKVPLLAGERTLPAGAERYSYVGVDRRGGLVLLAVVLLIAAFVVVRLAGLLAALGVLLSVLLVVEFVIPAILAGRPALLVALVGALAVMFVTVLLTNGLSAQSLAAILGISATLVASCALAKLAVGVVHLDGQSSELTQYLALQNDRVSLQGIVLAGMLIGGLGVLADTAVTQASAVMALRRANAALDARGLYRGAFAVGRDHLSATIHTLVLAYVGTALPLLLLMRSSQTTFTDAINSQDVAEPVTAAIVGCLALIAAVPITTGLAALLVVRTPAAALGDGGHGHAHAH